MTIGWAATIGWYFQFAPSGMNWGYSVIALFQAVAFWRMSQRWALTVPLFAVNGASILFHLAATVSEMSFWWTAFVMNRLFEMSIAYLAGCAIFRIRRAKKMGRSFASAPN
ncbi:MAG: hypothetical protein A3E78_07120 [Alphaproteobacteria bacterium RIFCSPHIGHO2_12_FULL_63_12]|nr:MAG: hypothetical protein A3E78_07120 [Alphaproteobacteria bacterium RIFCSPHIGHO2_12_FULL_63_12]